MSETKTLQVMYGYYGSDRGICKKYVRRIFMKNNDPVRRIKTNLHYWIIFRL